MNEKTASKKLPPNYQHPVLDDHEECAADLDAAWRKYRKARREAADLRRRIDAALALIEEDIDCGGPGTNSLRWIGTKVRAVLTVENAASQAGDA